MCLFRIAKYSRVHSFPVDVHNRVKVLKTIKMKSEKRRNINRKAIFLLTFNEINHRFLYHCFVFGLMPYETGSMIACLIAIILHSIELLKKHRSNNSECTLALHWHAMDIQCARRTICYVFCVNNSCFSAWLNLLFNSPLRQCSFHTMMKGSYFRNARLFLSAFIQTMNVNASNTAYY